MTQLSPNLARYHRSRPGFDAPEALHHWVPEQEIDLSPDDYREIAREQSGSATMLAIVMIIAACIFLATAIGIAFAVMA